MRQAATRPLTIGQCGTLACLLELVAAKPGNVHRGADFTDLGLAQFAASAVALGPALDAAAAGEPLGRAVYTAVRAMRQAVETNTHLGTILLLVPLAKVPRYQALRHGISAVLEELDAADSRWTYEAIRLAQPGGMGRVAESDLESEAPPDLRAAMRLAAERDLVARQYANGFDELLGTIVPWMSAAIARTGDLVPALVETHLRTLAAFPDSLIARKCGLAEAHEAAQRAAAALRLDEQSPARQQAVQALDAWLREGDPRRNPGTTADLVTAALFCLLRDGQLQLPAVLRPPTNLPG